VFRRLLRGSVSGPTLSRLGAAVAERNGEPLESVRPLEADNWLSTPCVVNERYFLKVITGQNSLVHALLTVGRNLGAFSSGRAGFFDHVATPLEMAERELAATREMRTLGVNAPEPLDAFEFEGHGVLVLEYLPAFRTLDSLSAAAAADAATELFAALATLHDNDLAHGDLRAENVLVADGELYFIDATTVSADAVADARAYDLACALAALEPLVGASQAVAAASGSYGANALRSAVRFVPFVAVRPDHDFDPIALRGELDKKLD
jgi:tRNA A-37 threonylcarbamoyl transferase component Bud32